MADRKSRVKGDAGMGVRTGDARRQSEEKLKSILSAAPVGIGLVKDRVLLETNAVLHAMTGYTRDELVNRSARMLYPADEDYEYVGREKYRQLAEHGTGTVETRWRKKDGTIIDILLSSAYLDPGDMSKGVTFTALDITERKRIEEQLRQAHKRLTTVVDSFDAFVYIADMETHELLFVNEYGRKAWGDVTGQKCWKSIQKDQTGPCPFCTNDKLVDRNGHLAGVYVWEFQNTVNERWYECRDSAIRWIDGRLVRMEIATDITARKQADEQVHQLQKAESLGRMAGSVAHHYNNLIGAVIGNLEIVMEDLPRDQRVGKELGEAMKAARKAAGVGSLMLAYLGQTTAARESLDLSGVCRQILPMLQAGMSERVTLEADLQAPGPVVHASTGQLQQVLGNLITNAGEAVGDARGTVRLAVTTAFPADIGQAHRYPVDWQPRDGAYACLEVRDTGGGIARGDIEKIFDPFYSTKFPGRGLGLPVVLGIVRAHNGVVSVESHPGRGSTFRVFVPLSTANNTLQPDPAVGTCDVQAGGTVLLVEDEAMVRTMASTMLARMGFGVIAAKDGVEAVEIVRQRQGDIGVVLCDLTMPRMNGWETLNALRRIRPGIPLILTSGYDEVQVLDGRQGELPQAFLHKPYSMSELKEVLTRVMGS